MCDNFRSKKESGPVLIESINIQVVNKTQQMVLILSLIFKNDLQLPSSREMRVKMNLSKDQSDFTMTNNDLTNRENSYIDISKNDVTSDRFNQQTLQNTTVQPQKHYSFYSTNSRNYPEKKEEGEQCDLDSLTNRNTNQSYSRNNGRMKTPALTANIHVDNGTSMHHTLGKTNSNYYQVIREQQKHLYEGSQRPDYSKVKMTLSQVRNYQNKHLQNISSNVRPKSQSILSKLTKQRKVAYEREQRRPNLNQTEYQQVHSSLQEQIQLPLNGSSQTAGNHKREIFSRKNDGNLNNANTFQQMQKNQNSGFYMTHYSQSLNQEFNNMEQMQFRNNSNEPYNSEFLNTGNWAKSNRLSQQKLEGISDYSFESSRLRKSPYHNYIQYTALKSQYYKPYTTSNQLQSKRNIFDNSKDMLRTRAEGGSKSAQGIKNILNSRNATSLEINKRGNQLKQDQNTHMDDFIVNQQIDGGQTMTTCFFDTEMIPDYQQSKSLLQQKRGSLKTSKAPIFITSTKKGLGLQKECAKDQMINYRSSLGQKVLKLSIDDPLKVKHQIWLAEKENFSKKNQNNDISRSENRQNESIQNQLNLASIMQNIQTEVNQPHDWTPKSSIVIEFQEPYKNQQLLQMESNQYSQYDSHNNSQNRSITIHNQSSTRQNDKNNKVIYSFNKGSVRNSQSKGQQIVRKSNDSKGSRLSKKRRSHDNDYFTDVFVEGVKIKKLNHDSGNISIRESFELRNSIDKQQTAINQMSLDKSQINTIDQEQQMMPKAYPDNNNCLGDSVQNNTIDNKSLEGSRDNIEEQDINVTQISIKVDQRRPNASIDHTSITIEKSKSQKSMLEEQKSIGLKSMDNSHNHFDTYQRVPTAGAIGHKRSALKMKRPYKHLNQTQMLIKSEDEQSNQFNTEPKIVNSQTISKNLKLINNNNNPDYNLPISIQGNMATIRKGNIIQEKNSERFNHRAKSAKSRTIPLNKLNPSSPDNYQMMENIQQNQNSNNKNFASNKSLKKHLDQYTDQSPIRKVDSDFSKTTNSKNQISNQILTAHLQSKTDDQIIEKFPQENSIGKDSIDRKSKNIFSKLQGRSLNSAASGRLLHNQQHSMESASHSKIQIRSNYKSNQNTRQSLQKSQGSLRPRKLRKLETNQDISVAIENEPLKPTLQNQEQEMIMIRDHDSCITNEEMKKSVVTINDEDSTLLQKSFIDGEPGKNGQQEQQILQPQIISRVKSGIHSIAVSSNQQSRSMLRTTYDQLRQYQTYFETNPSNQEYSTKRTVLMKRKTQHELNTHNLQTGDKNANEHNPIHKSITQVQFVTKEDLRKKDLNLGGLIPDIHKTLPRKITDLPRHGTAAPAVQRRNLDLIQKMKNREQLFQGNTKQKSQQMMMTFNQSFYKKELPASQLAQQQSFSRNQGIYQSQSMKLTNNPDTSHSDLIIDTTQQKMTNLPTVNEPITLDQQQFPDQDSLQIRQNDFQQYQNVQIPMPRYLNSTSQFSTIKNNQYSRITLNRSQNGGEDTITHHDRTNHSRVSRENFWPSKPASRERNAVSTAHVRIHSIGKQEDSHINTTHTQSKQDIDRKYDQNPYVNKDQNRKKFETRNSEITHYTTLNNQSYKHNQYHTDVKSKRKQHQLKSQITTKKENNSQLSNNLGNNIQAADVLSVVGKHIVDKIQTYGIPE